MNQPLAYIHPGAKIATNVVIEPFTTIHNNVEIGSGTWIGSNVTIMEGARIGKNCRIGKGVVFDHLFGDNITLEDNVKIDDHVYLDGHEYTITQTVFGKTLVKKGVHIKKNSFVRIGTTIGENTIIEKNSMAQRFIPPNEVWGGMPAKFIRKRK